MYCPVSTIYYVCKTSALLYEGPLRWDFWRLRSSITWHPLRLPRMARFWNGQERERERERESCPRTNERLRQREKYVGKTGLADIRFYAPPPEKNIRLAEFCRISVTRTSRWTVLVHHSDVWCPFEMHCAANITPLYAHLRLYPTYSDNY